MNLKRAILFLGLFGLVGLACSLPIFAEQTPGQGPTNLPGSTATTATTPFPQETVAAPAETNTLPAQVTSVRFYFVSIGDAGQSGLPVGCGDSLVAIDQPVEPTNDPLRMALERLFSFKQQNVGESGLYTALWQSNLQVQSAEVDANGAATVQLTGNYLLGGECDTPRFKGQIEQTILDAPGVESAQILLNGVPIDQALSSR